MVEFFVFLSGKVMNYLLIFNYSGGGNCVLARHFEEKHQIMSSLVVTYFAKKTT